MISISYLTALLVHDWKQKRSTSQFFLHIIRKLIRRLRFYFLIPALTIVSIASVFTPAAERYLRKEVVSEYEPVVEVPGPVEVLKRMDALNRPLGWDVTRPVRAIYINGNHMKPVRVRREVKHLKAAGGNAIVFDVKDVVGVVNYKTDSKLVESYRTHRPPIGDLDKMIKYLHSNHIYAIARVALFQDGILAKQRPDLAIRDVNAPGKVLLVKGRPLWVDPAKGEVRDYNLEIVRDLVKRGVDEIQFDYVRYPAEGNLKGAHYERVYNNAHKTRHLMEFLSAARILMSGSGVKSSIDVFGVVAWNEKKDVAATGQDIPRLARMVDVISPMLYPSHFNPGFDGKQKPADEGFYFYDEGVRRVRELAGEGVVVRPWLQAFAWRVTHYNEDYIREQIRGNQSGGGVGWLMWNAASSYNSVYRALQ